MKIRKLAFFFIAFCNFFFIDVSDSLSFDVHEVADGVFVHYGLHEDSNKSNKGDIANVGFIVGKKSILVVDTGGTLKIGEHLLKKIREISKLPISHIVITHAHPDHFFGTEAFLDENPEIIGHEKLNRSMYSNFKFYRDLQFNTTQDKSLKETKLITATLEVKVNEIQKVDLGERVIEVKAWKSGHTDNDLSVFDKKTKVFWSENIFVGRTPSIRASVLGWEKNLNEINKMDIKLIVPGHGKVLKKKEALEPMIKYFNRLILQIRKFHQKNLSLQEAINKILQDEILNPQKVNKEGWILFTEYHYSNVTKVYTELEWE